MAKLAHVDIESGKIDIHKLQNDLNAMIGYIQTVSEFEKGANNELQIDNGEHEPLHQDIPQKPRNPSELLQQAPRVTNSKYFHMPPRGNTDIEL